MLIAEGIISSDQLARLAARIPVVLVAGSFEEPHADVVDADNRAGAAALTRHLVEEHGRTRLFYVAGPPEAPDARERRSTVEQTLASYPGATMTGCFEGRFTAISGQLAVREILAAPRRELPDPIVGANDQRASGASAQPQAAGLRGPADTARTGGPVITRAGHL